MVARLDGEVHAVLLGLSDGRQSFCTAQMNNMERNRRKLLSESNDEVDGRRLIGVWSRVEERRVESSVWLVGPLLDGNRSVHLSVEKERNVVALSRERMETSWVSKKTLKTR